MTAVPSSNVPLLWIVDTGLMATNAIIWLLWLLPQSIGQPYHIPKACRYVDSWCVVASGTLLGRLLRDYQWPEGSWNRLLGDRWIPVYLYPQVTGLVMSQTHHQLPWTFLLSSSILSQFQMLKYTKLQVRKIFKDMEKKKNNKESPGNGCFLCCLSHSENRPGHKRTRMDDWDLPSSCRDVKSRRCEDLTSGDRSLALSFQMGSSCL